MAKFWAKMPLRGQNHDFFFKMLTFLGIFCITPKDICLSNYLKDQNWQILRVSDAIGEREGLSVYVVKKDQGRTVLFYLSQFKLSYSTLIFCRYCLTGEFQRGFNSC
jgi:hypothetical protein